MNNLELFIDSIYSNIDKYDLLNFFDIISISSEHNINKKKMDRFLNILGNYMSGYKNNSLTNAEILKIIYFILENNIYIIVHNFLRWNKHFINIILNDEIYSNNIIKLSIQQKNIQTIHLLIDNKLDNFSSIINIYSKNNNTVDDFNTISNFIKNIYSFNNNIIYSIISIEFFKNNDNYDNSGDINNFTTFIAEYLWLSFDCDIQIFDVIVYILEYLNKNNLLNDDFKLLSLKKNKIYRNYYIFNDIINIYYFYGIKITNENYINLVHCGFIIANYQRFGILMNNDTMLSLIQKNIIPSTIDEIPNDITFGELFKTEYLEKKHLLHFINNGAVITSYSLKCLFDKYYINFNENMESTKIDHIIVQHYNITFDDFINYERCFKKETGLKYLLNIKNNQEYLDSITKNINHHNINLPDIQIKLNIQLLKDKNIDTPINEYLIDYINHNNLKIYNYFVTDNFLSKLFGVHKSCLLDLSKVIPLL